MEKVRKKKVEWQWELLLRAVEFLRGSHILVLSACECAQTLAKSRSGLSHHSAMSTLASVATAVACWMRTAVDGCDTYSYSCILFRKKRSFG